MNPNQIITGDAMNQLPELPTELVHAIVTDPPYGLAFMGRDWDTFEPKEYQEWCEEWAALCLDVLKPGGHLLAFSGNRTHHRLFSGVEDAGFEVRDTLTWHYGSGFPKALDVSKAIDKAEGKYDKREVLGQYTAPDGIKRNKEKQTHHSETGVDSLEYGYTESGHLQDVTAPATDAAQEWDGWKTSLKPATEFIVLARKPFEGTVAENVQAHGTAALNIDGNRIGKEEIKTHGRRRTGGTWEESPDATGMFDKTDFDGDTHEGRYPANVIFDTEAAAELDSEVGTLESGARPAGDYGAAEGSVYGEYNEENNIKRIEYSSGGPSRYFYTSKATQAERTLNGRINNTHPTVKPIDLMQWLVKLVTTKDQIVLDPFAGTGTTLRAAKNHNRKYIGIEKNQQWADVARARTGLTLTDPSNVRDEPQTGVDEYY